MAARTSDVFSAEPKMRGSTTPISYGGNYRSPHGVRPAEPSITKGVGNGWIVPRLSPHEELCQACHRINDEYPAGIVTLKGPVVRQHEEEIINLARNLEQAEKQDHPLNRIMAIDKEEPDTLVITTTDVHLPRRIGTAVHHAFHGDLKLHFDEDSYFIRVDWARET